MSERANHHGTGIDAVLGAVFEEAEDLLVVGPTAETVEELISVAGAVESPPSLRVLASAGVLKDVMADFLVASRAADLIESGTLSLRTGETAGNTLLVTPETVYALVALDERVAALGDDEEAFVESAGETFEGRWEAAEGYEPRTPPLSQVRASLGEEISPETRADFEGVLDSLETARGDGDDLDEVTISLLVAAKNDVLLYDISRWGEDVGIASKATFSRTKTELEELGLIDTEKVPIDVGRPRLRLKLGDDRLADASPEQLASVAQSIIAS
jgi:hypothetical protein